MSRKHHFLLTPFLAFSNTPSEPKLEYRVGESILVSFFLNGNHGSASIRLLRVMVCALPNSYFRTTGMELKRYSPSATARSMAVLGSSQVLGVVHEHRHVGVYQLAGTDFDNLICHFFRRTAPDEIAQLLQIPRMAFHDVAQLFCLLFADFFVRPVEGIDDEGHPFLFLYLLQEQYLSEAVERG